MSGFFDDYYGGGIDDEYPLSQPGGLFKEGGEEEFEKNIKEADEADEEVEYLNLSDDESTNGDSDTEYTFGGAEIINVSDSDNEIEYLDIIEEETKLDEDVDYVEF